MRSFLQYMVSKNPFFFGLAAIGPLLLLSTRLVYALSVVAILLTQISVMFLLRLIIDRFLDKRIWMSAELFLASVSIAIIDMFMSIHFPLIRADMGILLPYILFQAYTFLLTENRYSFTRAEEHRKTSKEDTQEIFGKLSGYIIMFLLLAFLREILSYGRISFVIQPWESMGAESTFLIMFTSTIGLLFLFTAIYAIKEEK